MIKVNSGDSNIPALSYVFGLTGELTNWERIGAVLRENSVWGGWWKGVVNSLCSSIRSHIILRK